MIDVQKSEDDRKIPIRKVGVREIRLPITWKDSEQGPLVSTVGSFSGAVSLSADKKGTHMSRFLECFYEFAHQLSPAKTVELVRVLSGRLESTDAIIDVSFSYFFKKHAPVTKAVGVAEVKVSYEVFLEKNRVTKKRTVEVPVQTLCPCSKAIANFGAHNQRSCVSISVLNSELTTADLVAVAESAASVALYPVLKREDEKFVTEAAFENPKFVEDLVRDTALALRRADGSAKFEVRAENFESIHTHNVWAVVSSDDL